ncbi:RNA polymerase, sigma-24 subunit, ECF subfamily [Chthoniobacter flavus Ellin428]|uniref:RNA polymerase, sigma-24 subunit, ECF subfamily n=2 Tax=Chthoniobacter flavus TaxID=191863 RepID=B4D7E9_9BACT|nr:RNA polymerase, sigma-24 subunit, ECF subfamily [Chthoniobacter flavus Ellin428]TCO92403.1 RNA polymerase sigma-70 factor (ECF subfamily) [Chthoniobacter flavus]
MQDMRREPPASFGPDVPEAGRFELTRWSVVVAAGGDDSQLADKALEHLCHAYWYPLYAFVRREGHSTQDAQDLTQEFFARLLQKGWLQAVRREKGRFRSFLLASMRHFLANEWDRAHALKRGGLQSPLSFDAQSAEERYALEPADPMTADRFYERRWALTLLDRVLARLRREFAAVGKETLFEEFKPSLSGGKVSYAEIAARLNAQETAVRVAAHRFRLRYRDLIRAEIADTVAGPGEVDAELARLFAALAS